jgi:hypothetical protein
VIDQLIRQLLGADLVGAIAYGLLECSYFFPAIFIKSGVLRGPGAFVKVHALQGSIVGMQKGTFGNQCDHRSFG